MKRPRGAKTRQSPTRETSRSRATVEKTRQSRSRGTNHPRASKERNVKADPRDPVSFSVVVAPATGVTLAQMRRRINLRTAGQFDPNPEMRLKVVSQLKALGFEVFHGAGPVVTARGTVRLFTQVFGGQFVKRIRERPIPGSRRLRTDSSILLKKKSERPTARTIPDVLHVWVGRKPTPATPSLPPSRPGLNLHLPGEIAQVMRASATHRRSVAGDPATGAGVTVAVLDTGVAHHPYYEDHDYRITRLAASDEASDPAEDDDDHGTSMLAGLLACAPDVHVIALKYGDNPVVALDDALANGAQVIALPWGYDLSGITPDPPSADDLLPLQERILSIVASGVPVVAAAGNLGHHNFPAMMPEVIAVGGVAVDVDDALMAWSGASSFSSTLYGKRRVPDVCGIASQVMVPLPPDYYPDAWDALAGATSFATCQVAGIVALLVQKDPTLTPEEIRDRLTDTAMDVTAGTTATSHVAKKGRDLATGFGLVNALEAWNSVP